MYCVGRYERGSAPSLSSALVTITPKDLWRHGKSQNEHPSASTAAGGSGGLASAPAFEMRVACAAEGVYGRRLRQEQEEDAVFILGFILGFNLFRRAGVSHRPDEPCTTCKDIK